MGNYIKKRTITGVLTIVFSFCLTFFLTRCAPGNPLKVLAGTDNPNPELIEHLTIRYGLDKSLPVQFVNYVKDVFKGDLGYSYISNRPVTTLIAEKIFPTILLSLTATLLSVVIGTILGIYAARRAGSILDRVMCGISYVFDSLPGFWLGLILILIFASGLGLLPTSGMYDVREDYEGLPKVLDIMRHMILPVSALLIIQTPAYFRVARSSVIQTMSEDFVLTLRATGMSENKIFNKYILRNAIIPTVTIFSSDLAFMVGGVTFVEIVFAWPGMGRLIMEAITRRDYPLLTGIYLMISISICIVMLITDIVYAFIDPRIRLR
ncbi:ABC transporter permease [Tepidimicrobium xylanilyticum]|uniref:ABC transporter permease n=1 Tax=Tepidimicrobium xylanilyticum TaxID=1123352 RepID=UPI002654A896|nr:ABC transporter permease [Tepidimicrobium xylanilyticum]GMG97375.1 peptide transporter [Tepidimicrobium xylanilyticum]